MLHKYSKLLAMILALAFIVSCSDDSNDPSEINEAEILVEYIESSSDYVNTAAPAMITATDVNTLNATGQIHVIDVRAASDYANGHIPGAVNVSLADLLDYVQNDINPEDYDKIAVACYSGQSASWGTSLMRLMGYDNMYTLKFGMSSWSEETNTPWKNGIGNDRATQFTADVTEKPAVGELPEINTGETTGAAILEARVRAVFAEGIHQQE
jgi:rhodanese-related sulfurtransferase